MKDKLTQSLDARQITLPEHEIDLILLQVESISDCLTANYSDPSVVDSIKLLSAIVIGYNLAMLYISSQSASASRSFAETRGGAKAMYNQLMSLDKHNCTVSIVTDPDAKADPFIRGVVGR